MLPKFNIGDVVWRASFDAEERRIPCPDCGGTGRLRVIFHDESVVSIECGNCRVGYDPPRGTVRCYERTGRAHRGTINGIEVSFDKIEYRVDGWIIEEDRLSDSEAGALGIAARMAAEYDAEERRRILNKEKDTRSWAWNASYHRKCIKEAQRTIEYHTTKLSVAAIRAKEKNVDQSQAASTP